MKNVNRKSGWGVLASLIAVPFKIMGFGAKTVFNVTKTLANTKPYSNEKRIDGGNVPDAPIAPVI